MNKYIAPAIEVVEIEMSENILGTSTVQMYDKYLDEEEYYD